MDSIFVMINHIEDPNKKKDLFYLMRQHKEVVIVSDIYLKNKNGLIKKMDFVPWLMIKNTGRGIYLVKKILEKFEPWVTIKIQQTIHKHNIPDEFWGVNKWSKAMELKFGRTHLKMR